jgi:transposase
MRAYSMDLRQRVVDAVDEGKQTKWEISLRFKVSPAWIRRLLQRRRLTGSIEPKLRDYTASSKVDDAMRERLREAIREDPDATLAELIERLQLPVGRSALCQILAKMGLTLKKSRYGRANRTGPMYSKNEPSFATS